MNMSRQQGFSLVSMLVSIALISLIFSALFVGVQTALKVLGNSKAQAGATALMVDRMEYIRSLPYDDIGTEGGVPAGTIPQLATTTLNGVTYNERILIQYIDDDADGIGAADSNGILADYKQIKIEYTWPTRTGTHSAYLVSNVVPRGIETTAGGGTIRVNVFDASVQPVPGASVRFVNNTATSSIDTIRYTDASGIAYLSAAPAIANYEVTVTAPGYSTDGTYVPTASNPNPVTPPVAVLAGQVSTMNFQIDELSDLTIKALAPATYGSYNDDFNNAAGLVSQASTTVSGGSLVLTDAAGVYDDAGTAVSTTTSPAAIETWYTLDFNTNIPSGTTVKAFVLYDNGGSLSLIPDIALAGNSAGFSSGPIDLTNLSVAEYGSLAVRFELSSSDSTLTPEVLDWELRYIESQTPIAGAQFTITGDKIIGTDDGGQPVPKYTDSGATDANGEWLQTDIEYDSYDITLDSVGYDIYEICPNVPVALDPGTTEEVTFTLGSASGNMLRVNVSESDGTPIPNASVRLENTGIDQLSSTSLCGQTYFSTGLYEDNNYTLTVSATGFTTTSITGTTVTSSSSVNVILN